jgi:hypothetical protein
LSGNPVIDRVPWGKSRLAASVAGKIDVRCDMTTTEFVTSAGVLTSSAVLPDELVLAEAAEIDLRWRAETMGARYRPLDSWFELDLLLMRIGQPGFGYLIVESVPLGRFVQAMGDPEALIIEVCGDAGVWHPDVWRLRRPFGATLPHAALDAQLWDGGMDARSLFTAGEAAGAFRQWLRGGSVAGVELEAVRY